MGTNSRHEKAPVLAGAEASGNEINFGEEIVMGDNSTAVPSVIPFSFGKQQVRTLLINGEPWFAAKDIINSLEYAKSSSPAKLTEHVPEQWKGVNPIHTPGGIQSLLMLSEQGMYFFLGRSDKPKALPFQMWLAGEVLPDIRRKGRYEDDQGRMATLIGQTIGTDGFHMLGAIVKGKVASLPAPIQRRATAKIWSQVHAAFGVRSAADIPADQLDSARNFIAAYSVHEGDYMPKGHALPITGGSCERLLVSYDHKGNQKVDKVPANAFVLSHDDLLQGLVLDSDIPVTTEMMFEYAMAALINLKARHAFLKRSARA